MSNYQKIIREHQESAPVKMVALANKLGLTVYEAPNLPNKVSGLIKSEDGDAYSIYVNKNHSDVRKRFTIAHEIAHYCLHKYAIGDGITDDYLYRSGLTNLQEREANQFAADLLMPVHLLEEYDYKNKSAIELSPTFNVSESAMSIRLRELGVIK